MHCTGIVIAELQKFSGKPRNGAFKLRSRSAIRICQNFGHYVVSVCVGPWAVTDINHYSPLNLGRGPFFILFC
jgi:hypothetical protein